MPMATNQLSRVLQTMRRAAHPPEEAGLTDGQLLEIYVRSREEAAFAALVRRHGPMVWGVCRRILRSHQDAEDAFQATFLVLVRKAASLAQKEKVANWLYGVAHQTALKARATTARRQAREKQVIAMPEPALQPQALCNDLLPLLDQELSRLPDPYREVIVLCDLEGKTRKEAARQFRLPEGTVATRLARARALLAKRLTRPGLVVSGGALAAVLAQDVAAAGLPPSVASSTVKAATLFAAGQAAAGGISVKAVALAEGALKTMLLTKLKIATAVLVVVAVLGAGAATLTRQALAGKPAEQPVKDNKDSEKESTVVLGVVKAVAAEKGALTVKGSESTFTLAVARDARIDIDGWPGKLSTLRPGMRVELRVTIGADRKVRRIQAEAALLGGVVKAVDAEKSTVTVAHKGDEKTFAVARDADVRIDGKPGKLADLPVGALVALALFVDLNTPGSIQATGRQLAGFVKSVDAEKSTITLDEQNTITLEGQGVESTFGVARSAAIEIDGKPGKLAGLRPGVWVGLHLGADQKTAQSIRGTGPAVSGFVKAVDAQQGTLTLADSVWNRGTGKGLPEDGTEHSFRVPKGAAVEIDDRPGELAGLPSGAWVALSLSVDQKTARSIRGHAPNVSGVLQAVDAEKGALTITDSQWNRGLGKDLPEDGGESAFTVARGAAVEIDGKPGKLADLPVGRTVALRLCVDCKTVRGIHAAGPGVSGAVKEVDAGKGALTISHQEGEKTFTVAKDADVRIDGKPGTLAGLPKGAHVSLSLSLDQKTVRNVAAEGPGFSSVVVKAVDGANRTITFDDRVPAALAGKTLSLAKDADVRIDGKPGKLAALPAGALLELTLSVDQRTVRRIQAEGARFLNARVKAVDAGKGTITFDDKAPAALAGKTVRVAKDANIRIDGKPDRLAALPAGALLALTLSVDQKTARHISAEGPPLFGVLVKAVDAEKRTLTVARREGETTLSVARGADVRIDGKPGKLADLPKEAIINVRMSADQKTVRHISAEGPSLGGGAVKSVDVKNGTLTFDDAAPANVAGKTFPVARDARIRIDGKEPSKLADLPGTRVNVTLAVDRQTIRGIDAQGPVSGVVQSVNAERRTISVALKDGETTFSVAKGAIIEIDGQPSTLAGIASGTLVTLSQFAGQTTVRRIQSRGK
jgi:RNA polymerase sigma factor (sigma-70 family)